MENWFDIVEPHRDIKEGDFDEGVFAAKLDQVVAADAPPDYRDPYVFYKKTYFTAGLNSLLKNIYLKLTQGRGSGVIEIQTPFGGGKTHSLISIYHYVKNSGKVRSLLPEEVEPVDARVAVIVGNVLNPLEGRRVEGLEIKTLWGDIAYQLAGKNGYEEFERNDQEMIAPGKGKLEDFLKVQEPFVILFDEILDYYNRAIPVQYRGTNLGIQTLSFLQQLSETVSSLSKGLMVVTLPSSELEDPSEKRENLGKLEKVFGRVESIQTPVKDEEVYSVITRRLFERTIDEGKKDQVIHEYLRLYEQYKNELPQKARDVNLKRKMELSYPFHPDVIDILMEKWGTFASFQRTRGALRLLANVVEDLYNRERNIDLILPSDINLENPSIRQEFLKCIGIEYEGIIASDIAGHDAKSQGLDRENRSWNHLAERISTAVFYHSFTSKGSDEGVELPYIKLATLHQGTIPSMVTELLQRLSKTTLWYLNEKNGRYFFSKIPNLNRMILDKKENFKDSYKEELKELLHREVGRSFASYIWPRNSEEVPDNQELKLVILDPDIREGEVDSWIERRGNNFRVYKNTLIFAFSDPGAYTSLREDVKTYLALKDIRAEIESDRNPPLKEKLEEVEERIKRLERDFSYNLRRVYHTLQVGGEVIDLGQPSVGKETLSGWYKNELEYREKLVGNLHYRMIIDRFLGEGKIPTKKLLEQFYKDKNMVMLSSPEVLKQTIRQGVSDGAIGIAILKDEEIEKDTFKFATQISAGEVTFYENEYLLSKQLCQEFTQSQEPDAEEEPSIQPLTTEPEKPAQGGRIQEEPEKYRTVAIKIEGIPSTKIADLNRGVLMPISKEVGEFDLNIEINISNEEGISRSTVQNKIKETIEQIGARITREDLK